MDEEIMIEIPKKEPIPKKNNKKQNKVKKNPSKMKNSEKKAAEKQASKKRTTSKNYKVKEINNNQIKKQSNNKSKKTKKMSRGKKLILFLILIGIILAILFSTSLFNIETINVSGNTIVSSDEIISLSGIQKHSNLFRINKSGAIANLKTNAYVEDVFISRKLPNQINIEIEERVPKYMLQFADSYVYVNNQGYMLEISNEKLNIPILIGISTDLSNIEAGNRMNLTDLKKMDMVINIVDTATTNEIGHLITKIDISDNKNYTLILESEGKTVYLGDCSELNTRILYLKKILEEEQGVSGELFLNIDLNQEKVRFKPSI